MRHPLKACVLMLVAISTPAWGQVQTEEPLPDVQQSRINQLFDDLEQHGIAGAACGVVQNGQVVHLAGYGVEDRDSLAAIDPYETRFYLASVTKAITATAIMRLVDQGQLKLDQGIADYLPADFEIDALGVGPPITLRHLMTHTAGFDDRNIGMAAPEFAHKEILSSYLRRALPPQIRPAGEITMYDNHGWALAGLVAESAAQMDYESIVEQEVFGPLEMNRTQFKPPFLNGDSTRHAAAYVTRYQNDELVWQRVVPSYRQTTPAGSVWSTADDMLRFMSPLLEPEASSNGAEPNRDSSSSQGFQPYLSDDSIAALRSCSWSSRSTTSGLSAGFWLRNINGHQVIMIMGAAPEGASIVAMAPEQGIGIFLAASRKDLSYLIPKLDALLDQFAPGEEAQLPSPTPKQWEERARHIAGEYFILRFAQESFETLAKWQAAVKVEIVGPGEIRTVDSQNVVRTYHEVDDYVFRQDGQPGYLAFKNSSDGKHVWLTTTDGFGYGNGMGFPNSFQKAKWHEHIAVKRGMLQASLITFAIAVFIWPCVSGTAWLLLALFRRRAKPASESTDEAPRPPRLGRLTVFATAAAGLIGLLGVALLLSDQDQLVVGLPAWSRIPAWSLLMFVGLSLLSLYVTIVAWKRRSWLFIERCFATLVVLVAITLIPFLWQWHLLAFGY